MLSLSKIGRLGLRMHRPLAGTPTTVTISREADVWYACISCAQVHSEPLLAPGQETGIDVGLKVLLITADGEVVENPRHSRTAQQQLARAHRARVAARRGTRAVAKQCSCWPETISRSSGNAPTSTTRPRWRCCGSTTWSLSKSCRSATAQAPRLPRESVARGRFAAVTAVFVQAGFQLTHPCLQIRIPAQQTLDGLALLAYHGLQVGAPFRWRHAPMLRVLCTSG
jgi:hypothetical protein